MSFSYKSATTIAEEIGSRIKQARLNLNMTQQEVAERADVSRKTVVLAEQGSARLDVFISILQALGLTEHLDMFVPVQEISPIQIAKLKGKRRKRASGNASDAESYSNVEDQLKW